MRLIVRPRGLRKRIGRWTTKAAWHVGVARVGEDGLIRGCESMAIDPRSYIVGIGHPVDSVVERGARGRTSPKVGCTRTALASEKAPL